MFSFKFNFYILQHLKGVYVLFKLKNKQTFKHKCFIVYFLMVGMWVFPVQHNWESEVLYVNLGTLACQAKYKEGKAHFEYILNMLEYIA